MWIIYEIYLKLVNKRVVGEQQKMYDVQLWLLGWRYMMSEFYL